MSIESLLTDAPQSKLSPEIAVRTIATDKGTRLYITYLSGLSQSRFDALASAVKTLWTVAQNDMIATEDSGLMQELVKYPHIASFLKRVLA